MRERANKFNDNPTPTDEWWEESELFEYDRDDIDLSECALLADELAMFEIQADADPRFEDSLSEWHGYILDERLWLPLEKSCHAGVLLPLEQIHLRLATCPRSMRDSLWYFFGHCPTHVKHYTALQFWVMVRVDRARRTGSPEWDPQKPPLRVIYHDSVFFQPPK